MKSKIKSKWESAVSTTGGDGGGDGGSFFFERQRSRRVGRDLGKADGNEAVCDRQFEAVCRGN